MSKYENGFLWRVFNKYVNVQGYKQTAPLVQGAHLLILRFMIPYQYQRFILKNLILKRTALQKILVHYPRSPLKLTFRAFSPTTRTVQTVQREFRYQLRDVRIEADHVHHSGIPGIRNRESIRTKPTHDEFRVPSHRGVVVTQSLGRGHAVTICFAVCVYDEYVNLCFGFQCMHHGQ